MKSTYLALLLSAASAGAQAPSQSFLPGPPPERCTAAPAGTPDAVAWLDRAAARVMPASLNGQFLRFRSLVQQPLWEQSDRMYAPFIPNGRVLTNWLDLSTNVVALNAADRQVTHAQFPEQIDAAGESYSGRDTAVRSMAFLRTSGEINRRTNPWVVLAEWGAHAADVRVVQRCLYRDYGRIVLARGGERLYLTESDGVPIKLERTEPHYLWGQVHVEYLWSTWWGVRGGGIYPVAAFRQIDGYTYQEISVVNQAMQLVPTDSAPRLSVPAGVAIDQNPRVMTVDGLTADTVRVNDHTFLLVTPAYTEALTLVRDTVFLLDATSGEERARQDSTWMATLFPGRHPVVLVVTDLAWPHISSVRFWVARGATIVSSRMSEDFLRRVVDRRWTLKPDALEKARATAPFRFRAVGDSLRLADGALTVHAMLGNSTEGALAVWSAADRFLWAGDYIQPNPVSPYYYDVVLTARALGLRPEKVGAEHMPLMDWNSVDRRVPAGASGR